ncbi:hypothetical protein [Psychroflexus planctonicus]|uniref:Transposase n=2 Tax=Psychroflexus planctonicus TaxID=1526575 RepID=A0ABQ1SGW2_9FLAO|nr:hypothetical protein [Psychroflexus planctonicus]GGE33549.1 hypothetical protein GCM10010832_12210 [Psychroflexus planctonicus]
MKLLKQIVGIDVAQVELVCCYAVLSDDLKTFIRTFATFKNNSKGFSKLLKWLKELQTN